MFGSLLDLAVDVTHVNHAGRAGGTELGEPTIHRHEKHKGIVMDVEDRGKTTVASDPRPPPTLLSLTVFLWAKKSG
jgi:hypothetical protein